MNLITEAIVQGIGTVVIFSLVPFLWWLIKYRKQEKFLSWLGFKKPHLKSKWWVLVIFGVTYYFFYNFDVTSIFSQETLDAINSSDNIAANAYTGIKWAAIIPGFIESFVANALGEEILFRGFINKRLGNKIGMTKAIIIVAVLFGLMHNILYLVTGIPIGVLGHILMFLFTSMGAILLGFLDEKIYNGSIIPSIILHGLGNFISTIGTAFLLW